MAHPVDADARELSFIDSVIQDDLNQYASGFANMKAVYISEHPTCRKEYLGIRMEYTTTPFRLCVITHDAFDIRSLYPGGQLVYAFVPKYGSEFLRRILACYPDDPL